MLDLRPVAIAFDEDQPCAIGRDFEQAAMIPRAGNAAYDEQQRTGASEIGRDIAQRRVERGLGEIAEIEDIGGTHHRKTPKEARIEDHHIIFERTDIRAARQPRRHERHLANALPGIHRAARTRGEQRRLRSPLADVAGMLRSFHYAAHGVLTGELAGSRVRDEDRSKLEPIARFHYAWSAVAFLAGYLRSLEDSLLLPSSTAEIERMLDVHLIEKALSEIGYELDTRPGWVALPLGGLAELLDTNAPT